MLICSELQKIPFPRGYKRILSESALKRLVHIVYSMFWLTTWITS
uniref:Uncharacterized protein n=1 Tax=Arundo donax TaxID=35708 RepID=A0A0A9SW53_ARUDO